MAASVPASDDDELRRLAAVGDFVELWQADRDVGVERSLTDYLARFPGHEAAIAREFLVLSGPPPAAGEAPPRGDDDGERVGPYRLMRLLGQGGQGAVWLAEDTRLRRTVALKVLASRSAPALRGQVERLRREAQALAKLAHPGICAIHEAVLEGPRPYLAMQWIDGENLAALMLRRAQTAVAAPVAADEVPAWIGFFAAAADALQAAHALGVLHRDVKPGNLMRTAAGQPVLLDFGFARDIDADDLTLTQSGELFGTLPYMAPEVLAGRPADARSDVYGLAATMYEVLAGRRPFASPSTPALRAEIERGDPPPLLRFAPVAAELSLVLSTALERDPGRRYGSAAAFAEDLRRVAAGTAVAARPVDLRTRLWRLVERHPVWATGSTLLAIGFVVAVVLLGLLTREQQQLAREQQRLAREQQRLLALRNAYRALQLAERRPGLALAAATEAAQQEQNPEITEVLYRVLDRCYEERELGGNSNDSPWLSLTPDGQRLLRASERGIAVLATATGEVVRTFPIAAGGPAVVAAIDDNEVVFAGADGVLRRCDLSGVERARWQLHAPVEKFVTVAHIAVAPDRRHVATAGSDGGVAIIDLATGSVVRGVGHNGGVGMVVFAPDGDRVASVSGNFNGVALGDFTVRVFATNTGELLRTFGPYPRPVHWCSWSSDDRLLAIARDQHGVEVRAVATWAVAAEIDHPTPVHWVGFAPGDRQLAIGSSAGLTIHELASGRQVLRHADFGDRSVYRGAFSPDGKELAVIAWDDTARVYEASTWTLRRLLRGVTTRPRGLLWKGDSSRLFTTGGEVQSWYPRERPFLPTALAGTGRLVDAAFTPDGASLVAATDDGTVTVHDPESGATRKTIAAGVPLRRVHGLRDGRLLLIARDHPPRLADRTQLLSELGQVPATMGWQAADGALVLAGVDGSVRICEPDGRLRHTVACHCAAITCGRVHPERPWLLSGAEDRTIALCDLRTGTALLQRELWSLQAPGQSGWLFDVAFAGSGDEAFAVGNDKQVRAIALPSGQVRRASVLGPTAGFVLPSADGRSVLVGGQWSGRLSRLASDDLRALEDWNSRHLNMMVALVRQPGGRLALAASKDGVVSIFVEDTVELVGTIRATEDVLVTASFSPEGRRILTADARGRIRIWPVDPLPLALAVRPRQVIDENDVR